MTTPVSPSSSPRLPSPPPIAEDQSGPTSPGLSLYSPKFPGGAAEASRRIRPGTKAEDMAEGPPLTELMDIDSAFQLTEYLKALHHSFTHSYASNTTIPITADLARQLAHPPHNTAKEIWLYELGRFLIQKTNAIIIALFSDTPACSATTCHEMRASEWQYLCAVHDPPKSCSAIDYCCHTLDWAASTLCNSKLFPSRLGLGSSMGASGGSDKVLVQQMKEITNIFRRVYRIYAHAWFQHREVFWRVEGKTGLYVFFKTVCDEYGLIQTENYTIPPEAEGLEPKEVSRDTPVAAQPPAGISLLKRPEENKAEQPQLPEPVGNEIVATGDTTKRHRNTAQQHNRSNSVSTTIAEEVEEDDDFSSSSSKPALERAPTVKKEGGLARSDTLRPEPFTESEEANAAAQKSIIIEEPPADAEEEKKAADSKPANEDAEDEEAEITVIEAEVPDESTEGPGGSAAETPEEPVKAEPAAAAET